MRRSFWRSASAVLVVSILPIQPNAWAWGNTGHEAVAFIAWKLLDTSTKDKVWALLQRVPVRTCTRQAKTITIAGFHEWSSDLPTELTEDQRRMYVFMRAATYADTLKHSCLHDSDTVPADMSEATANLGFTDGNSHGYWHFVDTAFGTVGKPGSTPPSYPKACLRKGSDGNLLPPPTPVTQLPPTPPVNVATEIKLLSQAIAAGESFDLTAYDMVWLEHLVGDVHQPLHASVRFVRGVGDTGGNCVEIKVPKSLKEHFRDADSKLKSPTELHAFWDDLPGIGKQTDTQPAADYAAALPAADETLAKVADPDVWVSESFAMAKSDVYTRPILKGMGSPTPYVITKKYYGTAAADAQQRIALAGSRLANLLMDSLKSWTPPAA
jgi:hypothetical protein